VQNVYILWCVCVYHYWCIFNYLSGDITACDRNSVPELAYAGSLHRDHMFCARSFALETIIMAKVRNFEVKERREEGPIWTCPT
jgi:hypothetical protein